MDGQEREGSPEVGANVGAGFFDRADNVYDGLVGQGQDQSETQEGNSPGCPRAERMGRRAFARRAAVAFEPIESRDYGDRLGQAAANGQNDLCPLWLRPAR